MNPGSVLNEKVAEVMVVFAVIPDPSIVKVAVWFRNGLCGPLPAMEPSASEYVPPVPGGPIMVCRGASCAILLVASSVSVMLVLGDASLMLRFWFRPIQHKLATPL